MTSNALVWAFPSAAFSALLFYAVIPSSNSEAKTNELKKYYCTKPHNKYSH